jgi:hypothetical protein
MPTSPREQSPLDQWFQRSRDMHTAWWLVAWVALYGVLSATQLLIWLAAVGSLVMLVMTRGGWRQHSGAGALWLLVLFFLIPGLLSLPGAVDFDRALSTAARFAAYGLAGLLFLRLSPSESQWPNTVLWMTGLLVLWSADGIFQEWRGVSLSGYPLFTGLPKGHKVTGSMGLDYGPNLAMLSPFLFETLRLHGRRLPVLWLAVPLLAVAVSLSASRYSALLLLVSAMLCGALWVRGRSLNHYWTPVFVVLLSIGGLLLPIMLVPHLAERLLLLGGSLSTSEAEANAALAFRPELWKASCVVFTENWINGVGLRGASGAMYPILAASDFFPHAMLSRTWHPHLGILEIATDTGLLGVLGYLLFLIMVTKWMLVTNAAGHGVATTFLCIALLAMFPLSSALSMYSFSTGSITWPALALALGAHFKAIR